MNWRAIAIILAIAVILFLLFFYSGGFMHGDPVIEPE